VRVLLRAAPAETCILKVISKRAVIFASECHAFGKGAIATVPILSLRFDAASLNGARTHDLLDVSESSTARLLQPVGCR
jgi:hypothetical protein